MIYRVQGVAKATPQNYYQQGQQTKYYMPKTQKQEVKKDFGIYLDAEIKKLKINILI